MARLICLSIGLFAALALPFVVLVPGFGEERWDESADATGTATAPERPCKNAVLLLPQLGLSPADEAAELGTEQQREAAESVQAASGRRFKENVLAELAALRGHGATTPVADNSAARPPGRGPQPFAGPGKAQAAETSGGTKLVCDGDVCWLVPDEAGGARAGARSRRPRTAGHSPAVVLLMEPLAN